MALVRLQGFSPSTPNPIMSPTFCWVRGAFLGCLLFLQFSGHFLCPHKRLRVSTNWPSENFNLPGLIWNVLRAVGLQDLGGFGLGEIGPFKWMSFA